MVYSATSGQRVSHAGRVVKPRPHFVDEFWDGASGTMPERNLKILVVEDHGDTSRLMARLLQGHGHDVRVAEGVNTALAAARGEPFDLLISDIGLPDGTGLELMRELLARRPIKGIALTGYGLDSDIQATRRAGFDAHLTKPIKFGDVEDVIRQLAR